VIQAASWQGDAMKGDLETLPANELADKFRQALKKEKVPATPG
jgi:negative regulator of sigma E activity